MTHRRSPNYVRDLIPEDLYPCALDDAVRTARCIAGLSLVGILIWSVLWLLIWWLS